MLDMLKTMKALVAPVSVSGREGEIARVIRELAAPHADACETDVMGNLIAHKKGPGAKVMVSAHMDSIGFMATFIEKEGFIRFGAVGGLPTYDLLHQRVRFENGTEGVVCADPDADMKKLTVNDLLIDIGAVNEADAASRIAIGDTAVYAGETFRTGDRMVSHYMDNRVGCLVLLLAMERLKKTENDVWFVFSSQEEVGLRGAMTAAYAIRPAYGVAVDVTVAGDVGKIEKREGTAKLGGGAAVKVMDHSVICHPQMVKLLGDLAKEKRIPFQMDVIRQGGTDAGSIHTSRTGVVTGGISIPTRYIHSPAEMVDTRDVEACAALLAAFLEKKL